MTEPEPLPEHPELDALNIVMMSHLLLAVGAPHRGKFNALLDAYAKEGGTADAPDLDVVLRAGRLAAT